MPTLAPAPRDDQDVYQILDDFGHRLGRAWRETNEERTDRRTLITDLIDGQYSNPMRVVAFNTAEGWSRDVSADVADEIANQCRRWLRRSAIASKLRRTAHRAASVATAATTSPDSVAMPKRIQLPPGVARSFVRNMHAYHSEKNGAKREAIIAHQAWLLNQHLAKPVKVREVKALFYDMKDHG